MPAERHDQVTGCQACRGGRVPAVTPTMPAPMLAGWPGTGTTQDSRLPGYPHGTPTRPGNR